MAAALKPSAPLAFTYHHNKQEAYLAAGMAILDAGLTCTASIPCPAEMGGSIHISGTGSSIVDTVFVCRSPGVVTMRWRFDNAKQLVELMRSELEQLVAAGMRPSAGDIRCIAYGHIIRMAIANLRETWDSRATTATKLTMLRVAMDQIATLDDVKALLEQAAKDGAAASRRQRRPVGTGVTGQRLVAMIEAGVRTLHEGVGADVPSLLHRLDKMDTRHGLDSLRNASDMGVPYAARPPCQQPPSASTSRQLQSRVKRRDAPRDLRCRSAATASSNRSRSA